MKRELHPDDVNMWIDGMPVFVTSIHTTTSGRFTIRLANGVDYSFDHSLLSDWVKKFKRAGGGPNP